MTTYHSTFFHLNKCMVRTPMLSLNHPLLSKDVDLQNKEEIISAIISIMDIRELHDVLQVSHSDFYLQIKKNIDYSHDTDTTKLSKIYLTLYKFLSRISFRSTPYSLFSGVSVAEIMDKKGNPSIDKSTLQIDIQPQLHDYIKFVSGLSIHFLIDYNISLFVNPSLYSLHDKYYYVEKNLSQVNNASLINVSKNKILKAIIDQCGSKGRSINEITDYILNFEKNYSREDILSYVYQLTSSQILLPDLFLNPSEEDLTTHILKKLDPFKNSHEIRDYYSYILKLSKLKGHDRITDLKEFKKLYPEKNLSIDTRITTDKINVPSPIIDSISQQCFELFSKMRNRNAPFLDAFISKYLDKYEHAKIPLLEALDPNYGIGYAEFSIGNAEYQPLTNGLNFGTNTTSAQYENPIDTVVERTFYQFLDKKQSSIDIEKELNELPSLRNSQIPVNESAYIFGNLTTTEDLQSFTFFPDQVYANQASKLLKRFSNMGDDISDFITDIYRHEQEVNKNTILAEVITIPNNQFSNIVLTKASRNGEIPHFTNYNKNKINVELRDIVIYIQDRKVRLFSKKLKKEIIPVVSHPYNTYLEDPICKFLSDVANQFTGGGRFWNWGKYNQREHLPRITYKNIIIAREAWCLHKIANSYTDTKEADILIQSLIKDKKLPQKVVMSNAVNSDNEIILDLSLSACRLILAKEINFNTIYLFEDIYSNTRFLHDQTGYYNTEIVVPFINKKPKFDSVLQPVTNVQKRSFLPTEEWLYVKIYAGSKLAEKILSSAILPFTEKHRKNKTIDQWFFIKYNDPDYHIRIRFHRSPDGNENKWQSLLYDLSLTLSKKFGSNFHYKLIVDTYKREIERYGEIPLDYSESLFWQDSVCIASFIKDLTGNEGEIYRYKFALMNVDNLLNSFNYSLEEKKEILNNISTDFFNEHKEYFVQEKTLRQFLNNRYRELKYDITQTFNTDSETYQELAPYLSKRTKYIRKNSPLYKDSIDNLIYSYIHMTLNRLFLINPRHHELLVYHLLNKYYESEIAKRKSYVLR
nr:lantibiotic dehydratase [uncultured Chryseobacterium sp.]